MEIFEKECLYFSTDGIKKATFKLHNPVGTKYYYTTEPFWTGYALHIGFLEYKGILFQTEVFIEPKLIWLAKLHKGVRTDNDVKVFLKSIDYSEMHKRIIKELADIGKEL